MNCQMSASLAELEGRLKRSTEELQASEAEASQAREWHEARQAELLRSLSTAEQAASDAAAQAEAAAADKDEVVRAAEQKFDAMQKEKVLIAVNLEPCYSRKEPQGQNEGLIVTAIRLIPTWGNTWGDEAAQDLKRFVFHELLPSLVHPDASFATPNPKLCLCRVNYLLPFANYCYSLDRVWGIGPRKCGHYCCLSY